MTYEVDYISEIGEDWTRIIEPTEEPMEVLLELAKKKAIITNIREVEENEDS